MKTIQIYQSDGTEQQKKTEQKTEKKITEVRLKFRLRDEWFSFCSELKNEFNEWKN